MKVYPLQCSVVLLITFCKTVSRLYLPTRFLSLLLERAVYHCIRILVSVRPSFPAGVRFNKTHYPQLRFDRKRRLLRFEAFLLHLSLTFFSLTPRELLRKSE